MGRFALAAVAVAASFGAGHATDLDAAGLVQKSIAVTEVGVNMTQRRVATDMFMKVNSLVKMIDHDIKLQHKRGKRAVKQSQVLKELFDCTRNAGLATADNIMAMTNDIVSLRLNCGTQETGKDRRACAKTITGFLANVLGTIMILPELPSSCFLQDCSEADNYLNKIAPVVAAAGGVELMLNVLTAIGNIDAVCVSKESGTIGAVLDKNLKYPSWAYWAIKPFALVSNVLDIEQLAVDQRKEVYPYGICAGIADFAEGAMDMMEALFDVKGNQEYMEMGDAGGSASYACASGITKLLKALPGSIGLACGFESCRESEEIIAGKYPRHFEASQKAEGEEGEGPIDKAFDDVFDPIDDALDRIFRQFR